MPTPNLRGKPRAGRLETLERLAQLCQNRPVPVVLNTAPIRTLPFSLLQRVAYFVVNPSLASRGALYRFGLTFYTLDEVTSQGFYAQEHDGGTCPSVPHQDKDPR